MENSGEETQQLKMSNSSTAIISGSSGENIQLRSSGGNLQLINQRNAIVIGLFVGVAVSCLFLYHSVNPFEFLPSYSAYDFVPLFTKSEVNFFIRILF